jgi:hypothetical protein
VEALDKVPELCEIWSGQSAAKWFAPQQEYSGHVAKLMTIIDDDGTVGQEKTFAMKEMEIFRCSPAHKDFF